MNEKNTLMHQIYVALGYDKLDRRNRETIKFKESEIFEMIHFKYVKILADINVSPIQISKYPTTFHFRDNETREMFYISTSAGTVRVFGTPYNPHIYRTDGRDTKIEQLQEMYIHLIAGILRKRVRESFTLIEVSNMKLIQQAKSKEQIETDRLEKVKAIRDMMSEYGVSRLDL